MARLLTKDEMRQFTNADLNSIGDGTLYLELRHHPSLASAHLSRDEWGRVRPVLGYSTSYIPLQEEQLHAIFDNLYTARFVIQNGFASRYAMDQKPSTKTSFFPYFAGIPDGIYEFYYGKAYEVKWQGITTELPKTHPIYQFDAKRVQQWFNIGIEFYTHFAPQAKEQKLIPSRYGYFRNQDLYLMGAPILKKEDPLLITFLNREYEKQSTASAYVPFQDNGPPLRQDGSLDIDFIRTFGLKIPEKSYLALGDNYAMSADSRDFGFVPEDNVRGGPDFIFWPPGSRWGHPNQPPYPFINLPRSVVWVVFIIVIIGWRVVHRRRSQLPLKDL
jgi:signal peptidase I